MPISTAPQLLEMSNQDRDATIRYSCDSYVEVSDGAFRSARRESAMLQIEAQMLQALWQMTELNLSLLKLREQLYPYPLAEIIGGALEQSLIRRSKRLRQLAGFS